MSKAKNSAPSLSSPKTSPVDTNIYSEVQNGRLIISLPWNAVGKDSSKGTSLIHASTHGNKPISVDNVVYSMGVNVYKKK